MLTSTLMLPGDDLPLNDPEAIRDRLEKRIDLVIEAGACGMEMTTVVDLTGSTPELIRAGLGPLEPLGLE
jgi:tRNA A37 threonylcarbamoyladenosine synthetase subunit TsaC/SUA5/YrdC